MSRRVADSLRWPLPLLACCVWMMAGCGRKPVHLPEIFPVTGDVCYRGGQPLGRGLIQLRSETDPSLNISGSIVDGKFTISTSFADGVAPGTMPGRYRVTVTPAFALAPQVFQIAETLEVGAEPAEFHLTLPVTSK